MNTIKAFEKDIFSQIEFLNNFIHQKQIPKQIQKNCIFCGSGDSYAAALLAEAFSGFDARAADPLDLLKNKPGAKKHVYFVSISGNTISNIRAAKKQKNSTAITKNPSSRLARACKNTITLSYDDSKIITAGSIGFLASALCCISLVFRFKIKNPATIFDTAQNTAKKIKLKNKVYILGNQHTYPVAMYAAFKLYELVGYDAHYTKIEQFSHAELFSVKPKDTVIIFDSKNTHSNKLKKQLKHLGIKVWHPVIPYDEANQVIFYTILSQFLALNLAKQKGLDDCYFISAKKIRNSSSALIY